MKTTDQSANNPNDLEQAVLDSMFEDDGEYANALICNLHEHGESDSHNCLACNFADLVETLKGLAQDYAKFSDAKTAKITFLLWLYLLVERMQEILMLISFPDEIKSQKFPNFLLVKRWANFFKHPKAFFLTHHAQYDQEPKGGNEVVIDDSFINRFYAGDKKNKELYERLTNKADVLVLLPDLIALTKGIGQELAYLSDVIRSNPIYGEILVNKSVLEEYFSGQLADS